MSDDIRTRLRLKSALVGMAALAVLWSCDGENLFSPSGTIVGDEGVGAPPQVEIEEPEEPAARPVGDSVLIRARASDDAGVDSVLFGGVAFRGDSDLGTDTIVSRYFSKMVRFDAPSRDTTVSRYLNAHPDDTRETAVLFAIAYDSQGNLSADSVQVILGGPSVRFLTIQDDQQVQAGLSLNLQVEATDPEGILDLVIEVSGAFSNSIVIPFNPPMDTVRVDTAVVVPSGVTGIAEVTATARNGLDVTGQDGPVTLQIVSSGAEDEVLPTVTLAAAGNQRLETTDQISVTVSGEDDSQGSGITRVGYTVKAISPERGDTLVRFEEATFSPARTGQQTSTFKFRPFNVDTLHLPDTLVYEITGWAVDGNGNCAASVTADSPMDLPCTTLATGERVADGRTGLRLTHITVAGRTVSLPSGGRIMDAAVDNTRGNLLLSNIQRNRVEIFRLAEERFGAAIGVGSEPWGLTLDRTGNQLLVANSGGTNISVVDLDLEREIEQQRFFSPDVVIFDVELKEGDSGFSFVISSYPTPEPPSFSDRPQYLAVDSFGNIIFSTRTSAVGDLGTARKAYFPPGGERSEVKLFVEHGVNAKAEDFWAVAHVDSITSGTDTLAVSVDTLAGDTTAFVVASVTFFDHVPGFPNSIIKATANTSTADPVENAWARMAAEGSDLYVEPGTRWNIPGFAFADTTFVTASGDGGWVLIGEGATTPTGRVMMYRASQYDTTDLSSNLRVWDELTNAADIVSGVGLNYDGTLGVARGNAAYFFDTQLQLNGVVDLTASGGGAGAALHPLHANQKTLENITGVYSPDTHLAFLGTAQGTIDIVDTFKFTRIGQITLRDQITGPLRAVLPTAEDNAGLSCGSVPVSSKNGLAIGQAVRIYQNEEFTAPILGDGGGTDDACTVVKLFATTAADGVVVVPVRKADVFKYHPNNPDAGGS